MPSAENEGEVQKGRTQAHLGDGHAVVYGLRVPHDPLQRGHRDERVFHQHACVHYLCETRGGKELRAG
jgi:hypothetical protein